jgi:coenzyme F420-0:L-glutamate ligase/coenzyme F420-1:gamma-L-glutamate ligase
MRFPELPAGVAGDARPAGVPVVLAACLPPDEPELAAGAAVATLLLALHAQGLAGVWTPLAPPAEAVARALDLPAGWRPLGTVAIGHPTGGDRPNA